MVHISLIVVIILVASPAGAAEALAQSTNPIAPTVIDFTQVLIAIVTSALSIIGAVLAAAVPILINKYVQDRNAARVIETAVQNSLGKLQQAGIDLATHEIQNYRPSMPVPASLQPGLQYVIDHAGPELSRLGVTPQSIADKIVSRIGLENIKTNQALTASATPANVGDLTLPVVAPPLAPVPAVVTAIVPMAAVPEEVKPS